MKSLALENKLNCVSPHTLKCFLPNGDLMLTNAVWDYLNRVVLVYNNIFNLTLTSFVMQWTGIIYGIHEMLRCSFLFINKIAHLVYKENVQEKKNAIKMA